MLAAQRRQVRPQRRFSNSGVAVRAISPLARDQQHDKPEDYHHADENIERWVHDQLQLAGETRALVPHRPSRDG